MSLYFESAEKQTWLSVHPWQVSVDNYSISSQLQDHLFFLQGKQLMEVCMLNLNCNYLMIDKPWWVILQQTIANNPSVFQSAYFLLTHRHPHLIVGWLKAEVYWLYLKENNNWCLNLSCEIWLICVKVQSGRRILHSKAPVYFISHFISSFTPLRSWAKNVCLDFSHNIHLSLLHSFVSRDWNELIPLIKMNLVFKYISILMYLASISLPEWKQRLVTECVV